MDSAILDYELLDSGDGEKLERFGDKILIRPCSTAVWKRHSKMWERAAARYNHKDGWSFLEKELIEWKISLKTGIQLRLRLQRNGQIGIFPEHISYFKQLQNVIENVKSRGETPQVLNLFAYTGMASLFCKSLGADVTHIDKAKAVLTWTKENLELNNITSGVRLIPEDAIAFLLREKKRQHSYHIVIADPPNFSRLSQSENWELDHIIIDLLKAIVDVVVPQGFLFISSHQSFAFAETVNNLLFDFKRVTKEEKLKVMPLSLDEKSGRIIPAGIVAYGKLL